MTTLDNLKTLRDNLLNDGVTAEEKAYLLALIDEDIAREEWVLERVNTECHHLV